MSTTKQSINFLLGMLSSFFKTNIAVSMYKPNEEFYGWFRTILI